MKTIVYQSYRRHNVPGWITSCMNIVEKWASSKGFDYVFIDDRMFEYVNDWYKQKVQQNILPISDLARLEIAKELLGKGYERTIWVDADLILFDPDNFEIAVEDQFAFTKEIWVDKNKFGFIYFEQRVCNAVTVLTANNSFLEFYIYACKTIVAAPQHWISRFGGSTKINAKLERFKAGLSKPSARLPSDIVGTEFLTRLNKAVSFPLLENIGLFSPILMNEIASGRHRYIKKYMRLFGHPIYGANLCGSSAGIDFTEDVANKVMDKLMSTKGNVVNQYLAS